MSCGNPHEANCDEVLAEVWIFLDQECDQERRELLQRHLDECHPCLEQYGIDEYLKELLARKCGGEAAPDSLKERLRETIRKTGVTQVDITHTELTIEVSAHTNAPQTQRGTAVE